MGSTFYTDKNSKIVQKNTVVKFTYLLIINKTLKNYFFVFLPNYFVVPKKYYFIKCFRTLLMGINNLLFSKSLNIMQFQTNIVKIMFRTIKLRNIILIYVYNKINFNYGNI